MADNPEDSRGQEVGRRTFSTSFRGFDQAEVRSYLELLAVEFASLKDRIAELEAEVNMARATPAPVDVATLTSVLGEETAKVLRAAQQAAEDLRAKAEDGAARTLREAQEEAIRTRGAAEMVLANRTAEADDHATRVLREADEEAAKLREDAKRESEAVIAQAVATGRDMVGQAQAARERVLADLAKRRKAALTQLEALRAGREELLGSFASTRDRLQNIMEDIEQADEKAREAAEVVGRATARAEARAAAAAAALPESDQDSAASFEPDEAREVPGEAAAATTHAGVPAAEPPTEMPADVVTEVVVGDVEVRGVVEEDIVEEVEVARTDLAPADLAPADLAPADLAPADLAPADLAPADLAPADLAPADLGPADLAPSEVHAHSGHPSDAEAASSPDGAVESAGGPTLSSGATFRHHEAAMETPPQPVVDSLAGAGTAHHETEIAEDPVETPDAPLLESPAESTTGADRQAQPTRPPYPHDPVPAAVMTGPAVGDPPAGGRVDQLFAQIRADRAGAVHEAREVLAESTPARPPAPTPMTEEGALEAPRTDADEAYLQRRDVLVESAMSATSRALKRALADDQNGTLERMRTVRGEETGALLEAEDAQLRGWAQRAMPGLIDGAVAGATLGDIDGGDAKFDPQSVAAIAERLASDLVVPLRRRLLDVLDAAGGDRGADTMDRVNSVFREWRSRIDRSVADSVTESVSAGFVVAVEAGSRVRWVVEDADGPCPDCDDNALSGAMPLGEPFPTGQIAPPAHPGCRCVLARTTG